ncbi:hypothetical protein P9112_002988 [Eukaryota sp. TZLM1-RC]
MSESSESELRMPAGPSIRLAEFLFNPEQMRGPVAHADYWTSVQHLKAPDSKERCEKGIVNYSTFRNAIDRYCFLFRSYVRPHLVIPSILRYLLLFFLSPFLVFFRKFRRLGRYSFKYKGPVAGEILRRIRSHKLQLRPTEPTTQDQPISKGVDVYRDGKLMVENVLNPKFIYGYVSIFFATYKIPIAFSIASALTTSILSMSGLFASKYHISILRSLTLVVYPSSMFILRLIFKDWMTSIVGSLPIIIGRIIYPWLKSGQLNLVVLAIGIAIGLYIIFNSFFLVRPAPPALMLFTKDGPLASYENMEEDGPWWLKANKYWVWRNLLVVSGEINKFWERDWERVELWINADTESPDCGCLEWITTDIHWREVWIPGNRLVKSEKYELQKQQCLDSIEQGKGGFWQVEVDADVVFHSPLMLTLGFVPSEERLPVQKINHLFSALFKTQRREDPTPYKRKLERIQLDIGREFFTDTPEFLTDKIADNMLSIPFT